MTLAGGDTAGLLPWLARQTWLLREPGSGTRATSDALLAALDMAPLTLMVGSNGAIRESAIVGLGVTLVPRDAVAAELASGRLIALPVPGTPLHLRMPTANRRWRRRCGPRPPGWPRPGCHAERASGCEAPGHRP